MKCPHKTCVNHEDCGILEITKKVPKTAQACSYFKDPKRQQKEMLKRKKDLNVKVPKKKNFKKMKFF
jgi:hypothetical protein